MTPTLSLALLPVRAAHLVAGAMLLVAAGCADDGAGPASTSAGGTVPSVTVVDQLLTDATMVIVDTVVSDGAGFLVIHEQTGGNTGNILGYTAVADGSSSDVVVQLDRSAVDGETLYAMLHTDANANGAYDGSDDGPVLDDEGEVISPSFLVTVQAPAVAASVSAEDQTLADPSEVTIASVVSNGPGILVVHESSADGSSFSTAIGNGPVTDGASSDLVVTLDRPAVDGEKLWAMLHKDDNGDGVYDSAADTPITADNGDVLMTPFVVTVE